MGSDACAGGIVPNRLKEVRLSAGPEETLGLVLFALGIAAGSGLLGIARRRARGLRPVREGAPSRLIADLESGRFRVTGRVVPIETTSSAVDGAACVFVEHAEYRTLGSTFVPVMREVEHQVHAHPFYLDDGSGRLLLDPRSATVEAVTLFEDGDMVAERRLRAGEEVELVASFAPADPDGSGGPYRASAGWSAVDDECGPPLITHRTDPDMMIVAQEDVLTALLRGAGGIVLGGSLLLGALVALI